MFQNHIGNKGISIIEVLVVVFIVGIILSILFGIMTFSLIKSVLIKQTFQANYIAKETLEAVRNFRDLTVWSTNGIGTLITNVDYYPQKSGNPETWQLVLGSETIDIFTRKVKFQNVNRDSNGNIVESGGVYDPDTKKAIAIVSWQWVGIPRKIELVTYFTNWNK